MQTGDRLKTLTSLGLTLNQARTYLTLVQSGPLTAKELSRNSKITRQDIYRVIPTLQKVGLVEKTITTPSTFMAIPVEQGLSILLERENTTHREIRKKTKELLTVINNNNGEHICKENEESQFVLVPEREALIKRMRKLMNKAVSSLDIVTSRKGFSPSILEFADALLGTQERNVKLRIATEKLVADKEVSNVVRNLRKSSSFELRCFPEPPQAIVVILDRKEALLLLSATAKVSETPALWSNNQGFLTMALNYFEDTWNTSFDAFET